MKKLGIGVGFRIDHYPEIKESDTPIEWFELITEQFISPSKKNRQILEFLKGRYPLALHGVDLAIGSSTPLDFNYLKKVKELAKETRSPWVSDHLSWGRMPGANFHDLLPLPFRKDVADFVIEKAKIVQDFLEVPFALENVSSFIQAEDQEMEEWEFYSYVVEKAGIYMMLDVNNVYVTSRNVGFDPEVYLDSLPFEKILQIHLAGHTDLGRWVIDSHDRKVRDEVWEFYRKIWLKADQPATLLEWDTNLLSFDETCKEALKAKQFQQKGADAYAALSY